jgi:hypothetical protein
MGFVGSSGNRRAQEEGKPHKLVLIAIARKIILIANALVAKNVVWRERWRYRC